MSMPAQKPRLLRGDLEERLSPFDIDHDKYPLIIVGIRGYYRDTMGKPGVNDRGIYDDAIFIVSPLAFAAFNANTDPSRYRQGSGRGNGKGMASLKPGFWPVYRFDRHRGRVLSYPAICQRAGPVTVIRDGDPPYEHTGMFGINIHRGGRGTTGSGGCQTVPPDQWDGFYALARDQARRFFGAKWKQAVIPYILLEEK
jgi:hypothetical protein